MIDKSWVLNLCVLMLTLAIITRGISCMAYNINTSKEQNVAEGSYMFVYELDVGKDSCLVFYSVILT